ncbi:putative phage baseplate assembly protein [Halohasta litchfieldiae]|jgi:predicted phage baseplate assembly protein|uniref:Putative baseplate assembly protein n=1 Tax=Halohasta litchfieldiae TaxID=1073996 RepID=A0A1H6VAF2_9EURY|nr:putative baseplate assembly protein [Halohasta litchfieldiae]ATW88969.1 putative phage baseplate assembly protein [Halohasta litchfieldiae]SEJ01538.1 putative baseplate assembly protein [Halohasta litchfieldiae]
MSIDVPQLDEVTHEELVSRAKTLVSAHSEAWTDFNPHDPGITIIELLAWLTETHSYELDQITDSHRKKYLQLLGVRPTPPQPASVRLDLSTAGGQSGRLPAGTQLTVDDGSGSHKVFTTDHATTVTDADLAAVVVDHDRGHETTTNANETDGLSYRAFGDEPTPGSALVLGFDGDPFESVGELSLFVDFDDADLPDPTSDDTTIYTDGSAVTFDPSVELVWEYCRRYPDGSEGDTDAAWEPLTVVTDTTTSCYETGFVRLERPETWEPTAWGCEDRGLFGHQPGLIWLRCRVETAGYEIPPQFNTVELNVVEASHRRRHEERLEPTEGSTDLAPRTYGFDHAPVLSATVTVDGEEWTEVRDLDASGPADRHYVLDQAVGELTFGDAERGARPPVDADVTASYVSGGGPDGNVPETARWWFSDGDQPLGDSTLASVDVTPKSAATGGREAESITAAVDRYTRDRQTPSRAVTESDYTTLAERTPGLRIARSTVRLPDTDRSPISVVVVPYAPPDVTRPTPSDGFRRAVQQQLDHRRLVTDRVTVDPPTYVGLNLTVSVTVTDRYETGGGQAAIETHLEAYLDPIRGFEGDGWPFGRSVTTAELRDQLVDLPAVDHVEECSVRTVGGGSVTPDGTVRIDEETLFYIENLQIDTTVRGSRGRR